MRKLIKKIFNIQDSKFRTIKDLKKILITKYPDEDFSHVFSKIIFNHPKLRNYVFITKDKFWFILDNGEERYIYPILKDKFIFFIDRKVFKDYFRIVIRSIDYPVLLSTKLNGSPVDFSGFIDYWKYQ